MRYIVIIALLVSVLGCQSKKEPLLKTYDQPVDQAYPQKVIALLALIKDLKPQTDWQSWLEIVDRTIDLPEEDLLLYGGGGLGESWQTLGIGAGDEWALSIESYQENDFIWEARVIRTSISKVLENEPCEEEIIYPYYYQGHLVFSEDEKQTIRKRREVEQAADGKTPDAPQPPH
jgi:hypothetical protein